MLSPNDKELFVLKTQIKAQSHLFIVAAPQTTSEEWGKRQFKAYIDSSKILPAFLTKDDAIGFAVNYQCVNGSEPMVARASQSTFSRIVAEYSQSGLITGIMVYSRVPLGIQLTPDEFPYEGRQSNTTVMTEQSAEPQKLLGVEEVKRALDTYEANARKKLDPGARYETFATLIQSLAQQNNIQPEDLDRALEMNKGYTRSLFMNVHTITPSKNVVLKYLLYFGLAEYLYLYARNCPEVQDYLRRHEKIDCYKLKPSPIITAERFRLDDIQRGTSNGFYVYKLKISSKNNSMEIIVSNPLNLQVGREYQLMDGSGDARKQDLKRKREASKQELPTADEMMGWAKEAEQKAKAKTKEPAERTYEQKRKDAIIAYFRKHQRNINTKSAEAKYKALEVEPDILDEFYKYTERKQFGSVEVEGYTAKTLLQKTTLSPYDAYLTLVRLRSDPKNTIQWLHDPQNQKPPKGGGKPS